MAWSNFRSISKSSDDWWGGTTASGTTRLAVSAALARKEKRSTEFGKWMESCGYASSSFAGLIGLIDSSSAPERPEGGREERMPRRDCSPGQGWEASRHSNNTDGWSSQVCRNIFVCMALMTTRQDMIRTGVPGPFCGLLFLSTSDSRALGNSGNSSSSIKQEDCTLVRVGAGGGCGGSGHEKQGGAEGPGQ